MIKAYHAVGTGFKTPDYHERQAALFDKVLAEEEILPARARLTQSEMRRRCVHSAVQEFLGVEGDLFKECQKKSPTAWRAITEILDEVADSLPAQGESNTMFSCLDMLAGDLDRIFLSVERWFGNVENGFVFEAKDLIRNGAVVRHRDVLDDIYRALGRVCERDFKTVSGARASITRSIREAIARNTYHGSHAMEFLENCVKRPPCIAEIVWTGPLPIGAAIEAWRDGVQVYPA